MTYHFLLANFGSLVLPPCAHICKLYYSRCTVVRLRYCKMPKSCTLDCTKKSKKKHLKSFSCPLEFFIPWPVLISALQKIWATCLTPQTSHFYHVRTTLVLTFWNLWLPSKRVRSKIPQYSFNNNENL